MRKIVNTPPKGSDDAIAHTLYDCSIDDINLRRRAAMEFRSGRLAAAYLGVSPGIIKNYTTQEAVLNSKRIYSKKHDKYFAVRISKNL